ncbi:hypothetical protein LguiA_010979 [Lonicera macranthoides]
MSQPIQNTTSQSDIDEIENLINATIKMGPTTVLPARPPSPSPQIPISTSPFIQSNIPAPSPYQKTTPVPPTPPLPASSGGGGNKGGGGDTSGFGPAPNTLTEPVWDTVKRDLARIVNNLKLVVFPNPFREDPGKALRDWDLWGPFFFIVFLGLVLSWSASVKKCFKQVMLQDVNWLEITVGTSEVFAVAFALLAAGWPNNLLPKLESIGLLSIPPRCWCPNLYVEGQPDNEGNCGVCYIHMELVGRLSLHEHSRKP